MIGKAAPWLLATAFAFVAMQEHQALASGFALREGSADGSANAFAGQTAKAYDASTAYTNPAGMVRLDQNEIDSTINYIAPSARFSGQNFVGPTATTPGVNGGNAVQDAVTFGTYGVWSYAPDLKFGFAVGVPFGQRVAYPSNFVGRYQSTVSSISDVNTSLSVAYRVNEHLSFGAGLVVDYFAARLTQAINTGPTAALTGDPAADVHGNDTNAGYNLGALYQFNENVRVGVDYRSAIVHAITGPQSIFVPPLLAAGSPATAAQLQFLNATARTKVTLPDNVSIGAYWQATPKLALMADGQWTDWSLLKSVNISPTNPLVPATVINENWHDTYFGSVGASYRVIDKLLLQTGVAYDQSPVSFANRTTRIPDYSRWLIGVGATYSVLPNLNVTVSYVHLFEGTVNINSAANSTSGLIRGKYTDTANTVSVGATLKF